MKKVLLILLILFIGFGGYILYDNYFDKSIPKLNVEEKIIDIDDIYIYGTHLNLSGSLVDDNNLEFVLYDGKFNNYKINIKEDYFNFSDQINNGLYLDDIPVGKYYAFIRSKNKDDNDEDIYKYYVINNNTEYKEMTYYTLSKTGNKIIINTDTEYNTLTFNVSKNKDKGIYDVVIDPGHGGIDSGASKNNYNEADMTMGIALNLKEKFEKYGLSVKLTREENQLAKDEKLNDYGLHGRAVIPFEVKAKYLFSIHMNSNASSKVNGIELYTPQNINYDFVKEVANNISKNANIGYSSNKINKVFDGVYTRVFNESDIESSKKGFLDKGMKPYDVTTKSNYYFMIRETGGIVTGAYVDDRNDSIEANPYVKSNVATESYLFELGYLSNINDLNNIKDNMDKFTNAIADTFNNHFVSNE